MLRKWRLPLGKLSVLSGKEVCAIVTKHGFVEVRKRGSHIVMQKKVPGGTAVVPLQRAEAVAAIRQGMEQFERGEGITLKQAERRLRKKHGFSRRSP